ncbi:hypothetical protein JAO76_11300 [Pontibacter sp. BT310]|uniref:Flagellar motor switch protein FliG C-terminal domain-containing protein n=1 Tax=Pontibacter populi TaxID=890055 RepID=A0ABS6XCA4_9BACT|nr:MULTISPECIES: hypothetical protein [Pontibacter]MBJ6118783.1 hypothetical protein [Pontibacter sp. BT310]MBR0571212.1 hypothetical protein [Microvirga sp. STS03]MBW3365637.1 hypothetical protein [Pontibacter populi]
MEYAAVILSGATQQLQKLFNTDDLQQTHSMAELQHKVALAVQQLLQTDLNRLLNILYRIDVDEHQVKQAMLLPSEPEVADRIAHLIIKRELQKAQTRFIYRSN